MSQDNWQFFSYATDPMLACSHCGVQGMDDQFMQTMDELRKRVGLAFRVNSGYRCPVHNSAVSSTGASGPHTTGRAIDIAADSRLRFLIVKEAMRLGLYRIGIAKTFIHLDNLTDDDGFPDRLIWSY
jgi:hypothetical protein